MIPGSANPLLLATAAGAGGYEIERSLRFNSSDSAYLSRTPASAGNRKTWTWAGWYKVSAKPSSQYRRIFGANDTYLTHAGSGGDVTADTLYWNLRGGGTNYFGKFANVYRDPSAWLHLVWAVDTTQATESNRSKLYVNGTQLTTGVISYCPQNDDLSINNTVAHYISSASGYLDGYLADVHFIDGQALDPSSFGEFDTNGVWQPIAYAGSYGTNGFRLDFSDNSAATATTLGKDRAGSNNWTPNNLSVTAGAGNDSLVDSPTNYGTDTGAGGSVRGNYCTLNPLDNGGITLANGNLDGSRTTASWVTARGAIGISSDKWYWEVLCTASTTGQGLMPGVVNAAGSLSTFVGNNARGYGYNWDANKYNSGTGTSYGATFTNGDLIGIAFDATAGSLTFYKNGASQGVAYTGIPVDTYFPAVSMVGTMSASANFGQRPFAYTAPSGFKALCTTNLPEPTIADGSTAFETVLWTGDGTNNRKITTPFSPDFVWAKFRNQSYSHGLYDTVRGDDKRLVSNSTSAEATVALGMESDGFVVEAGSSYNDNNDLFVAWTWDAGSSTVTNTQGSITSQVRANASAGFSVVTYTAGATNATVGHGLGVAPGLIIAKSRSNSIQWAVYHSSLGKNGYLHLDLTNAFAPNTNYWGTTGPNSTTFGLSTNGFANNSGNMVAYCFAPVAGYSSFGSYTGNGSATDGPFVYTGMRPRWILVKRTDSADDWPLMDTARTPNNPQNLQLWPNFSNAESTITNRAWDALSNGFKLRGDNFATNANGGTYIYAAFAESPFQYARAR